jgi:HlyD family secretion protein
MQNFAKRGADVKKILIIVVIIIAGAALGFRLYKGIENGASDGITLYGNVDIRDVSLGFRVSGRLAVLNFEEGDRVKTGDVLAVLDKKPYEDQLALYRAQLEAAKANFAKYTKGLRPQEIEEARAQVKEREATLKNLEQNYRRVSELLRHDAVSAQTHDDALAARDEAKARLRMAQKSLELALAGFREEDIQAVEAEYNAAAARVSQAETSLADAELLSPSDGIILTRVRETGSILSAGTTVYSVALDSPVWVRAYIEEGRLGYIHPGQKAEIYTDSRPGEPYIGHVGFISPQAEFTPKSVETAALRTDLVYRLRIVADNPDKSLRQGMPVTVKITEQ